MRMPPISRVKLLRRPLVRIVRNRPAKRSRRLNKVASTVDEGLIRGTDAQTLGQIRAAYLRAAHAAVDSGDTPAQITLAGV